MLKIMLTITTALLWALLLCALQHAAAGDAIVDNNDDATGNSKFSNALDRLDGDFSLASGWPSFCLPQLGTARAGEATTCKHRAAPGEAVILHVKFSMPSQPSSRNLELRWVRDVPVYLPHYYIYYI